MIAEPTLEELFTQALRVPDGPEREAWIVSACADNHARLKELRELLRAHADAAPSFLKSPLLEPDEHGPPPSTKE